MTRGIKYVVPEKNIHKQVAEYLRRQYKGVLFRTDMSGIMLTVGQRVNAERLQNGDKWPDLAIMEPMLKYFTHTGELVEDGRKISIHSTIEQKLYHGLFLEIKKDGTKLKKRNGEWASDHIREQAICHDKLRAKGYKVEFAVGFDEAKSIIDSYLK